MTDFPLFEFILLYLLFEICLSLCFCLIIFYFYLVILRPCHLYLLSVYFSVHLSLTLPWLLFLSSPCSPVCLHCLSRLACVSTVKVKRKDCAYRTCVHVCLILFSCLLKVPVLEMPHAEVVNLHKGAFFFLFFQSRQTFSLTSVFLLSIHYMYIYIHWTYPCCQSLSFTMSVPLLVTFFPFTLSLPSLSPTHTQTSTHKLIHVPQPLLFLRGADWSGSGLVYVHELSDTLSAAALHQTGRTTAR